jgi:hypothetical protein
MSTQDIERRSVMSRRTRRWIGLAVAAVSAAVLVWLPAAAQAGITVTGLE